MLDDIALFVQIVRQGSLSAAAEQLALPPATVTRRLQRLEQQLGCQLLHRSARQCLPTQDGEVYFQHYADLVEQFEQTRQRLSRDQSQMSGKLKVLAPTNISHRALRAMWLGFTQDYPDIQLELLLGNQLQDMISSRADLALRIGPQQDSLLYQQRLCHLDVIVAASPGYLAQVPRPEQPADLKDHRIIGSTLRNKWRLRHRQSGQIQEVFPRANMLLNDIALMAAMAADGQGVALLPLLEIQDQLNQGELVNVLPNWQGEGRDMYIVWPSGKLLSARAKCLRDYVVTFVPTVPGLTP